MLVKESDSKEELIPYCKKILRYHGMGPKQVNKKYLAIFIPLFISWQGVIVGVLGHLIYHIRYSKITFTLIADDLSAIVAVSHGIYVQIVYVVIKNETDKILLRLQDYTVYEKPNGIEKTSKLLDYLAKLFYVWCIFALCVIWLGNMIQNCEPNDTSNCGLVMDGYLPYFDIYKYPNRRIFLTFQLYGAYVFAVNTFYISWIFLCMTEFLGTYIKHFKSMLLKIPSMEGRPLRKAHIKKCVMYHCHILDLYDNLMVGGKKIMFIHVACTAIIISLLCYDLLNTGFNYFPIAHMSVWCSLSVVAGVFGERIIQESTTIPAVVYESMPLDGDVETQRDLLLIGIRGARMLYLPANHFGVLGHIRLMTIAKASYSYLALLINTV